MWKKRFVGNRALCLNYCIIAVALLQWCKYVALLDNFLQNFTMDTFPRNIQFFNDQIIYWQEVLLNFRSEFQSVAPFTETDAEMFDKFILHIYNSCKTYHCIIASIQAVNDLYKNILPPQITIYYNVLQLIFIFLTTWHGKCSKINGNFLLTDHITGWR